jgi:hypothetical protein
MRAKDDGAPVTEQFSVAVWAVQRAQVRLEHRALITGFGPIGMLVAQGARTAGDGRRHDRPQRPPAGDGHQARRDPGDQHVP